MGKRGVRISNPIRCFIIEILRDTPDLSDRRIADKVEEKFGEENKVDKSTVNRLRRKENIGRDKMRIVLEDPEQAERSGHWPGLRLTANALAEQFQRWHPRGRFVGLGSLTISAHDPPFPLDLEPEGIAASLSTAQSPLFRSLKEHLPGSPVWEMWEQWKVRNGESLQRVRKLCSWVKKQPELSGRRWLSAQEFRDGNRGLDEQFAQVTVMLALEDARGLVLGGQMRSVPWRGLGGAGAILEWVGPGEIQRFAVARVDSGEELESLKEYYISLAERLVHTGVLQEAAESCGETVRLASQIGDSFIEIANSVQFTGRCSLWQLQAEADR